MNFGIIGFGNIARKFAKSIESSDGGKVIAIASHSLDKNDPYLQNHPEILLYRNYEDLLADASVDAVYLALTHKYHKKWILEALEHHIPVLCEKPLVLHSQDVTEIQKKCMETDTYCMEALKTKFNTGFRHLKKDLSKIGKLLRVEANFCSDASHLPDTCFLFDPEQGGALNDIGSYVLGFILALCPNDITKISSEIKTIHGIEQHFRAEITFSDGCTALAEGAIDEEKERTAHIIGENGEIIVPFYNRITDYTIITRDGLVQTRHDPFSGDDMTMEIQTFMDDIKAHKKESSIHSLSDTKKILELTERIRTSQKCDILSL